MLSREPDLSANCDIPERLTALRRRIAENLAELHAARFTMDQRFVEWNSQWRQVAAVTQNQTVRQDGETSSEPQHEMRPQLSLIHQD